MFSRIWDLAGLTRRADGQQPRPYDFRHHFRLRRIERWMMQGEDVAMSRYMDHATFDSTYYYIHTSPDFMDAYVQITRKSQFPLFSPLTNRRTGTSCALDYRYARAT